MLTSLLICTDIVPVQKRLSGFSKSRAILLQCWVILVSWKGLVSFHWFVSYKLLYWEKLDLRQHCLVNVFFSSTAYIPTHNIGFVCMPLYVSLRHRWANLNWTFYVKILSLEFKQFFIGLIYFFSSVKMKSYVQCLRNFLTFGWILP